MSQPPDPSQAPSEKKTGVIKLDQRRAGQCSVCFIAIDTHYIWRARHIAIDTPKQKQKDYDTLLCDEHAEERMKL